MAMSARSVSTELRKDGRTFDANMQNVWDAAQRQKS